MCLRLRSKLRIDHWLKQHRGKVLYGARSLTGVFRARAGLREICVVVLGEVIERVAGLAVWELGGEISAQVGPRGVVIGMRLGVVRLYSALAGIAIEMGRRSDHNCGSSGPSGAARVLHEGGSLFSRIRAEYRRPCHAGRRAVFMLGFDARKRVGVDWRMFRREESGCGFRSASRKAWECFRKAQILMR